MHLNINPKSKLIYMAVPNRLIVEDKSIEKQMDVVTKEGNAPLHPFQAYPFERYEGGPIGKARTWDYCCRLVDIADEVYLFGIGHGTLNETAHAIKKGKPIKLLMDQWDPDWKKHYSTRTPKLKILDELL